ncbi:MAG: hypothetical protein QM765_31305 [Myxococcales bacterium]
MDSAPDPRQHPRPMLPRCSQMAWLLATVLSACFTASTASTPSTSSTTCPGTFLPSPWPEADALFHQSDRWAGGDAAYSVDLGGGRILWLFGDTFISKTPGSGRSGAYFPHNSVGLQTGRNPAKASMAFYWGSAAGAPTSFFSGFVGSPKNWLWPLHGVRVGGRLLLFFQEIAPASDGLGFQTMGGVALGIDNPDEEPSQWRPRRLDAPSHPFGAILGAAMLVEGDSLLAVSLVEPGSHDAYLARWPLADAQAGSLASPQWWAKSSWSATTAPSPLWKAGAPEVSVQARCGGYVTVQSPGFGGTTIAVATAPALTGPWSRFVPVFRPPESERAGVLVYAAKSHPELEGAELVVTYATNSTDLATLVGDSSLYFPRFVRLDGRRR